MDSRKLGLEKLPQKKENNREFDNRQELMRIKSANIPAVESFLDPDVATRAWPENIATNKEFLEQIKKRKELDDILRDVFDRLSQPDVSLEAAIEQGNIIDQQAVKLYASLSDLLENDPDYQRIVLYLPFEILPDSAWLPSNENLQKNLSRFRQAYMEAWRSLLEMYDPRANFVDGDILEEEHRVGDVPRVVKAAHLIPKLTEKGFMKTRDAIALIEQSDDEILKHSIADTLPVLADLGLLTDNELELMEKSGDRLVSSMARIIAAGMEPSKERIEKRPEALTHSSIQEDLREKFSRIDSDDYGVVTERRKIWLKQKRKQETIETFGEYISEAIIGEGLSDEIVTGFISPEANLLCQQALIEGIRKAIESAARKDQGKAQALYARFKETLLDLWNNNDTTIRGALSKTFRRFRQGGIIDEKQLAELNILMPKLAGPFSENLKTMRKEIEEIRGMTASIESKPELSQLIYPVVLVQGSRLNGYGGPGSDIDLSVFVKPGTSLDSRTKLRALLMETFSHKEIKGDEIVEFWLEEKEGKLEVHDFGETDPSLGGSYLANNLFGAAWVGDANVMQELREKLLAPYMYDSDKKLYGRNLRNLCLEKMEQGLLQYRLMHKGYEQYFPPYGGIHTHHADEIDGESVFWDSGYRQLATKLFASRVFLPKISRP